MNTARWALHAALSRGASAASIVAARAAGVGPSKGAMAPGMHTSANVQSSQKH